MNHIFEYWMYVQMEGSYLQERAFMMTCFGIGEDEDYSDGGFLGRWWRFLKPVWMEPYIYILNVSYLYKLLKLPCWELELDGLRIGVVDTKQLSQKKIDRFYLLTIIHTNWSIFSWGSSSAHENIYNCYNKISFQVDKTLISPDRAIYTLRTMRTTSFWNTSIEIMPFLHWIVATFGHLQA